MSAKRSTGPNRVVRAIANAVTERDQLEMRAVNALLEPLERHPLPRTKARSRLKRREVTRQRKSVRRWRGFRRVVCPIDFSATSLWALRYAALIARRAHGKLTVLYVNDPLLVTAAGVAFHDREIAERSLRELRSVVDAVLLPSKDVIAPTVHVLTGDPTDKILAYARRSNADLLVVGTNGLTGADRLLLGSTTLSLLQRAPVPVLAVPWTHEESVAAPSERWPGHHIIAAVELDVDGRHDAEVVSALAQWFETRLLLIHVVSARIAPAWLTGDPAADVRGRIEQAGRQIEQLATTARQRVATDCQVLSGRAADTIAAVVEAEAERAGLLVTILKNRKGWFGARRGSISYHVLSHAVTPVLACPSEWRPR